MTTTTADSEMPPTDGTAIPLAALSKRRTKFVGELAAGGAVTNPAWLDAFRQVPRDAFVPYFFQPVDGHGWKLVERPSAEWLDGVFSMEPLVTQLDGHDAALAEGRKQAALCTGTPTSSSTRPTAVAFLLDALDVDDDQRVLEIGTGSGWTTGLLCHRLGAHLVASVDVDPHVLSRARQNLAALGYHPQLEAVEGGRGCRARAPYDRVIATVAVRRVPRGWVVQSRTGAQLLVPIDLGAAGGLTARLTVDGGSASGPFLADRGSFMPTRASQRIGPMPVPTADEAQTRSTILPTAAVTAAAGAFFCALLVGNYESRTMIPDDGSPEQTLITHSSGAWACHTTANDGTHLVRQGGPRLLWNDLESAHHKWNQLGQPDPERFGLTAVYGRKHTVWLDHPHGPHQWHLA